MAIHRVGPQPDTTPNRQSLGKVLVTIDDLAVLLDLVAPHNNNILPTVHFDGGYITEAEDLRQLSDQELKRLRVEGSNVHVLLTEFQAEVIGSEGIAEDVYRLWARQRQTSETPRTRVPVWWRVSISIVAAFVVAASLSSFGVDGAVQPRPEVYWPVFAVLIAVIWLVLRRQSKNDSYALVKPMSLSEHRSSLLSGAHPRRANIIAIVAVIVAIIAVVASIVVK